MIRKKRIQRVEFTTDTIGIYLLPLIGISRKEGAWSIWFGWLWFLMEVYLNDPLPKG